jgi:hypothetical protein
MVKLVFGILFLLFGSVLVVWLVYNLFIERLPTFNPNPLGFLFMLGLFVVGGKWVYEWGAARKRQADSRTWQPRSGFGDDD